MARFFFCLVWLSGSCLVLAQQNVDLAPLKKWIVSQKDIRSLEADFIQTRSLKTLRSPLSSSGKLWFTSGGDLRWEIGNPPKTIFLRNRGETFLIHPAKREFTAVNTSTPDSQGSQKFPMMEFPIAPSFTEFNKRFEVTNLTTASAQCKVEVLPRDPRAQKYLKTLRICFSIDTGILLYFEVIAKDGSSLKNEFSNVRLNQKIDPIVFNIDLNGYTAHASE